MPEPWRGVRPACSMPADLFEDDVAIPMVDGELHFAATDWQALACGPRVNLTFRQFNPA